MPVTTLPDSSTSIFTRIKDYKLLTIIVAVLVGCGTALTLSLIRELRTPNFKFYGTHYDFIAFYSAASAAVHGGVKNIYDVAQVTAFQRHIIPHPIGATGYMPFLNPPFLAIILSPLALLSITYARLLWLVVTLMMAVFALYQLLGNLSARHKAIAIPLLLLTFPVYQTLIQGQVTILVLFGLSMSYYFLKHGRRCLSGCGLVLLWVFPQLAIPVLVAAFYRRQWTILKGWTLATAALLILTVPFTGLRLYATYLKTLITVTRNHFIDLNTSTTLSWRGNIDGSEGLNGFYSSLIGTHHPLLNNVLYVLTALLILGLFVWSVLKLKQKYSPVQGANVYIAGVLAVLLANPHLYAQGIVFMFMLLPALLTLYKKNWLWVVAGVAIMCDVVYLDQFSRIHIFTILILIGFVYYLKQALKNKADTSA